VILRKEGVASQQNDGKNKFHKKISFLISLAEKR
jgi:hypothetical protein